MRETTNRSNGRFTIGSCYRRTFCLHVSRLLMTCDAKLYYCTCVQRYEELQSSYQYVLVESYYKLYDKTKTRKCSSMLTSVLFRSATCSDRWSCIDSLIMRRPWGPLAPCAVSPGWSPHRHRPKPHFAVLLMQAWVD